MVTIRPAARTDAVLIVEFIHGLAEYERAPNAVVATESDIIRDGFSGAPRFHCVIADWRGEPAGFAFYFFHYSTWLGRPGLYLEDLFVKPELRGRGIGKALLVHLAKLANAQGCGRMEWSVLDWNQPAIDFYESLGAQRMTDWTLCRLTGPALAQYA